MTNPDRQAVIDIGSNTVRLVIFEGDARVPTVVLNEKVQAKLGKGLNQGGQLSAKSMSAAIKALKRFALVLNARSIAKVYTVATAAVRDATNGAQFLEQAAALGLQPRLLSGEEEALASAFGVIGAFPEARGVVADLGGGSLELVHISGWTCEHGSSLPLGTLRLAGLRAAHPRRFRRDILDLIEATGTRCQKGEALYLVGGSFRALAHYYLHITHSPLDDPHGFEIGAEAISKLCRSLQRSPPTGPVPGVSQARLNSLQDTASLLIPLIAATGADRLVFSAWGLREGVLIQSLPKQEQQRDPLALAASSFGRMLGVTEGWTALTTRWIAEMLPSDPTARGPILAAITLGLALRTIEPNLRGQTAHNWALRKRWIGLDGPGRAILAAALLASANRSIPNEIRQLAPDDDIHSAIACGMAMRLCWRLTGFASSLVSQTQLSIEGTDLALRLSRDVKALKTEVVVKDLDQLAAHLCLSPIVSEVVPTLTE
ncbi:MAG: hypothetical protein ACLGHF_03345 [Alphaproteobacteria bacterium]